MDHLALTGGNSVGKDTVADYLVSKGYVKYSFSDPIERFVQDLFEISMIEKDIYPPEFTVDTPRSISTKINNLLSSEFPFWKGHQRVSPFARKLWRQLQRDLVINPKLKFVISDYRYMEERAVIKELGCTVIQIGEYPRREATFILENLGTKEDLYHAIDALFL